MAKRSGVNSLTPLSPGSVGAVLEAGQISRTELFIEAASLSSFAHSLGGTVSCAATVGVNMQMFKNFGLILIYSNSNR